jgi:hypothetical protein
LKIFNKNSLKGLAIFSKNLGDLPDLMRKIMAENEINFA